MLDTNTEDAAITDMGDVKSVLWQFEHERSLFNKYAD